MALFRFLILFAIIAGIAGVGLYFAPDPVKEKVLSYVGGNPYIPAEIKQEAENLYATPAMKREKLITELNQNLNAIQNYIDATATSTAAKATIEKLVADSQNIVSQVLAQNADPTAIKQITDALAAKVISSNSCPTTK